MVSIRPKKFNIIIHKELNYETDICEICRSYLIVPPKSAMRNITEKNNILVKGICGHVFHISCMDELLKTNLSCPIDNTLWVVNKDASNEINNCHTYINKKNEIIENNVGNPKKIKENKETKIDKIENEDDDEFFEDN